MSFIIIFIKVAIIYLLLFLYLFLIDPFDIVEDNFETVEEVYQTKFYQLGCENKWRYNIDFCVLNNTAYPLYRQYPNMYIGALN